MEIRVGDVVQPKKMIVGEIFGEKEGAYLRCVPVDGGKCDYIFAENIETVIERKETDAEKIARLKARVKELEAQQEPKDSTYPDQLEGYGPWAKTVKVPAGAIVRGVRTFFYNGEILFCVKLA